MKRNLRKGFTVVELVIVIAVIGILSAVLIPTFVGLTDRANKAALQENLRNAYVAYAAENGDTSVVEQAVVYLSAAQITAIAAGENKTDVENVYKYDTAENKWIVCEKLTGKFTPQGKLNESDEYIAYNGYYVYTFEA